jgi:hypothetical protein
MLDTHTNDQEIRMKETDEDRAVRDNVYRVAADELRQFIERFARRKIMDEVGYTPKRLGDVL